MCRTVLCGPTAVGKREFLGNTMSNVCDPRTVLCGFSYRHSGHVFRGSERRYRGDALSPSRYSVSYVAASESPGSRGVTIILIVSASNTKEVRHESV